MSTSNFANRCHANGDVALPCFVAKNAARSRERKYLLFGDRLKELRGDRKVASIVRQATRWHAQIDEGTIRSYEYGWIASPDPVTLLVLARAYEASVEDLIRVLADSRRAVGEPVADVPRGELRPVAIGDVGGHGVEFGAVPMMKGTIAAGAPLEIEDAEYSGALAFNAKFLAKWKRPVCVRVGKNEESMVPLIMPNDVVLLESDSKGVSRPDPNAVYAVKVDAGVTLKRLDLVRDDGHAWLALLSENPDKKRYPVRMLAIREGEEWTKYVAGRVVWHGQHM